MEKDIQIQISKKIGFAIRQLRMQKEISIAKIASDLHLNPSTIVSIENGQHQASFINIYMITNYLESDIVALMNSLKAIINP